MSALEALASPAPKAAKEPVWKRFADLKIVVLIGVFLIVWKIAATVVGGYNVPQISEVTSHMWETVTSEDGLTNLFTTLARVGFGLACSFVVGTAIGLLTGANRLAAGYLLPVVRFIQGVPSLSWVIIAVIWFIDVETRVFFVMLLVTLPGFVLQTYDSYRAIPAELRDMARSFRPSRWALFREVTFPSITPGLFTAWKVNLGLGIRMVLIAELVGATVGVGSQLLTAQQLFDMAAVVSWTLLLAICMLILQAVIDGIEAYVLRYRAVPMPAATRQTNVSEIAPATETAKVK
ncbi:ABC transporter permease [Solicola gregarius]|uniref:ABC transporter permease subunit n=1 Tax=Solicola gregarius TaxID=2908642 RepID=A0AA46YKI1_9ACTN|nr:ABC transporter permease subunit [Solicola gregarius]UYM05499.1 ABC transporter permease subunit [Solicola gregarius]UYM05532.1 ABC transporter permease subunit [Solicola gregarius]